jgi:alpha-tubulin suppressor-like RCC1 family protein
MPTGTPSATPTATPTAVGSRVLAWGGNGFGQLGDGTLINRRAPVAVSVLGDVIAIAPAHEQSAALKPDGTVWVWGANDAAQLGSGVADALKHPLPNRVSGLDGVTAIGSGQHHLLVIKADGSLWAWGWNQHGQLGDGTTTNRTAPVHVSGLTNVVAATGGTVFTVALTGDGAVWRWGHGQKTPVQVAGLTGVTAIAAGAAHALALKADGTVWAAGANESGQLGIGTTDGALHETPVQVTGLTGVTAIAAGGPFSLALKGDGTVWAWGKNASGQLGDNTTTTRTQPVQVKGPGGVGFLTGVTAIGAGTEHALAVKGDGTAWAWGKNAQGQLGDGTTTNRKTPVQVGGLMDGRKLGGGDFHSLALVAITPTSTASQTGMSIPAAVLNAPTAVDEGSPIRASFTNPAESPPSGSAGFTSGFDWGDGGGYGPYPLAGSATGATTDNGLRSVVGKIRYQYGSETEYSASLTVRNVPPMVRPIKLPPGSAPAKAVITAGATSADPGVSDTHTTVWDCGDGVSSTGPPNGAPCALSESGRAGSVTDMDGDAGQSSPEYVVVHDLNGWIGAGGGWIISPAGAYPADPTLTGRAISGVVSMYKQGETTPTGQTEFQLKAGNLNFHSSSYDCWSSPTPAIGLTPRQRRSAC